MGNKLKSSFKSFNFFEPFFSEAKLNAVLLMNAEGIIQEINPAFTQFFGYKDEDIIGKYTAILFTPEDVANGLPETELSNSITTGQHTDKNYLVHKDKTKTWVSGESLLIKNDEGEPMILKVVQDIHEQKTQQQSLQRLHEFNERILASIDDIVIVIDHDMQIIKFNNSFYKVFAEAAGRSNFGALIKAFDKNDELGNKIKEAIKTATGFANQQIEISTSAGEKRMFDTSCRSLEETNGERELLLVMHDITILNEMERQREDIIGFVAHELRNPLANIVLCNELMNETLKVNKVKEALEFLSRSDANVMRLNKMIAELYDATKIGSGNLQLEKSEFNFDDMIKEAVETIKVLHPDYTIAVKGKADLKVNGDRYRLIQVVTNYLSNGIKYSAGNAEVELSVKHDDEHVTVSVKDEGLGISRENLPYVFNRFFRAEKTKSLEGIGLGLHLCRQVIKAHKGNVWVESEEDKGSTFCFSIPING